MNLFPVLHATGFCPSEHFADFITSYQKTGNASVTAGHASPLESPEGQAALAEVVEELRAATS